MSADAADGSGIQYVRGTFVRAHADWWRAL